MKKFIFIIIVLMFIVGAGCTAEPDREIKDQYSALSGEYLSHVIEPMQKDVDITPANDLLLESQKDFQKGDYDSAVENIEAAIKWLEDRGY